VLHVLGTKSMTEKITEGLAQAEGQKRPCKPGGTRGGDFLPCGVCRVVGLTFHFLRVFSGIKNIRDIYGLAYYPVNYLVMTFYYSTII
jgi:hypothetical protein